MGSTESIKAAVEAGIPVIVTNENLQNGLSHLTPGLGSVAPLAPIISQQAQSHPGEDHQQFGTRAPNAEPTGHPTSCSSL